MYREIITCMGKSSKRNHSRSSRLFQLGSSLLLLALSSCAVQRTDPAVEILLKEQLSLVSEETPHIASSQLLAAASEQSANIRAFFRSRGYPEALKANSATQFELIYLKSNEKFQLMRSADLWALGSPTAVSSAERSAIAAKRGGKTDFRPIETNDAFQVTQKSGPSPHPKLKSFLSNDSLSKAVRDKRGDLIHNTAYSGETLALITEWYTFDLNNVAAIARINRLSPATLLLPGTTVKIPKYLLKNDRRLPEAAVESYRGNSSGGLIRGESDTSINQGRKTGQTNAEEAVK